MKRHFFLILSLVVSLCAYAQQQDRSTNLFRYGKPLVSCDTNFDNLFANVAKYLDNSDDLHMKSYECIGRVKSTRQARRLLRKNFSIYPSWGTSSSSRVWQDSVRTVRESSFKLTPTEDVYLYLDTKKMARDIAAREIRVGDKIYRVCFTFGGDAFEQYVFVHADTREVVLPGNVFNVNIPDTHIQYVDGQTASERP